MSRSAVQVHINALGAVMGGAARHLDPFLAALHDARPDWQLHVWVYERVPTASWPAAAQPHTVVWGSQARRLRWENVELPRELTRRNADVLVDLTNTTPVRCPVPSLLYQRNALWFDRAWLARLRPAARVQAGIRRALTFAQARGATVVVTPTRAMADFLQSWRGWPGRVPVRVIPHAVDTARFGFTARPWPPPSDRALRLVSVGHEAPHKDQLLLIDLVGELQRRGRPAELALTIDAAEPDGYVAELVERCRLKSLTGAVHFLGRTADVERVYSDADIMVSASISESFGFPLIEAMAVGVPVVASAIPATVEVASGCAWFFPPGDVAGAADAVERALTVETVDMERRLDHAAQHAATFTWAANADAVAQVIDELVADSRG